MYEIPSEIDLRAHDESDLGRKQENQEDVDEGSQGDLRSMRLVTGLRACCNLIIRAFCCRARTALLHVTLVLVLL